MGTSVNQRSPENDNWRLVQDIYQDPAIPADEALRILWRAASNPSETNLAELLSRPEIATFADLAASIPNSAEAMSVVTRFVSDNKVASLASDIAKRAVMQSVGREDARTLYTQRLFAEATSYLVSRDLPGYMGSGGRFSSVRDARGFAKEMAETAASAARQTAVPRELDANSWRRYVDRTISAMRRRR